MIKKKILVLIILLIQISCSKIYKVDDPKELLKNIHNLVNNGNYKELNNLLYNIKYKSRDTMLNSSELILNGIINKQIVGNFAYSNEGIEYHMNYVNKYSVYGDDNYIKEYLIDSKISENDDYLKKVIEKEKNKIIFYKLEFTVLGFIEHDNKLKLFFTKDLTDVDISEDSHNKAILYKKIKK